MEFDRTWPALLIVIGLVMFLQHNAPATGHVPREYMVAPPAMPAAPWTSPCDSSSGRHRRQPAPAAPTAAPYHRQRETGGAQWLAHIQPTAPLPPAPPVYRYRRSLAGPLVLILIGGVFLLRNFGVHLPVWHFFGRFWPLLIILWGVIALVEHFTALRHGYQTRHLGGSGIFLLILIVIVGLAAHHSSDVNWEGMRDQMQIDDDLGGMFGTAYTFDDTLEQSFPKRGSLRVVCDRGAINVHSGRRQHHSRGGAQEAVCTKSERRQQVQRGQQAADYGERDAGVAERAIPTARATMRCRPTWTSSCRATRRWTWPASAAMSALRERKADVKLTAAARRHRAE